MIQRNRWVDHGTTTAFLIDMNGKIVAEIHCVDYPSIWTFSNEKYMSKKSAQEAAEKHIDTLRANIRHPN